MANKKKKTKEVKEQLWYSPDKVFSYNALINFVSGARGCGKTYGCKKWCIKRYIKTGKKFIYLRRNREDLKDLDVFFNAVSQDDELKIHEFKVIGRRFFMDNQEIGRAVALSQAQAKKSVDYAEYDTIVFDEFIIEDNLHHYLDDECSKLLSFLSSVFRNREGCRCICLSNSILWANPYFMYYKFEPCEEGIQVKANGQALLQVYKNKTFQEMQASTRLGKLMSGTEYGKIALENKFRDVNSDFIHKRSKDSYLMATIYWRDKYYGLWLNQYESVYVVSNQANKHGRLVCYTTKDYKPNMMLLTDKNNHFNKELKRAFKNGFLYYEDIYIRNAMFDLLNLLGVR